VDHPNDVVAVVGDVVGSRRQADRTLLQGEVRRALVAADHRAPGHHPLAATVGDEFQGLYPSIPDALIATLVIRLSLRGTADVRFGVGLGTLTTDAPDRWPFEQDGPAWWSAREAVEQATLAPQQREAPRNLRTVFASADPNARLEGTVNAFLVGRDELVGRMDERDAEILLGLMDGAPLSEVAARIGITTSAASQRAIGRGVYAVLRSHRHLEAAFA
jgi:SatD family (SatD)